MTDDLIERLAEGIWQAEWARAGNGGKRRVPWSEVAAVDQERYRFVARAVLAIARPAILEEAAGVARSFAKEPAAQFLRKGMGLPYRISAKPLALQAIRIGKAIRALATTGQEG